MKEKLIDHLKETERIRDATKEDMGRVPGIIWETEGD